MQQDVADVVESTRTKLRDLEASRTVFLFDCPVPILLMQSGQNLFIVVRPPREIPADDVPPPAPCPPRLGNVVKMKNRKGRRQPLPEMGSDDVDLGSADRGGEGDPAADEHPARHYA